MCQNERKKVCMLKACRHKIDQPCTPVLFLGNILYNSDCNHYGIGSGQEVI